MSRSQEEHSLGVDFPERGAHSYAPSDERLRVEVHERLTDDPHVDVSGIDLQVEKGVVELRGRVHDRWLKYHLEELISGCQGVKDVQNRLEVPRRNGGDEDSRAGDGRSQQQTLGDGVGM